MSTQAKTLEQLISELHTTNGDLVTSNNELTNTVVGKMGDINNALSNAQSSVADAVATADTRISDAIRTFAESHADMRINYYDRQLFSKNNLISDHGLVVDPTDETRTEWLQVPCSNGWGVNTYPHHGGLTKVHTISGYSYSPGYHETPQYTEDWSRTYMQFVLTNIEANSTEINEVIESNNIPLGKVGGWWNGARVHNIPCIKVDGKHPYSRLFFRLINVVSNSVTDPQNYQPQNILTFGGNCNFSLDRVVNYPRIPA